MKEFILFAVIVFLLLAFSTALENSTVATWANWYYLAGVLHVLLATLIID
jgi:hypothetical protein